MTEKKYVILEVGGRERKMIIDFSKTEVCQLITIINDNVDSGEYYGRRDYWYKRNENILKKLAQSYFNNGVAK